MNIIRHAIAGAALIGGTLLPSQSQAEIHEVPHTHVHHVAVGVEADKHKVLSQILYTREMLLDHFSFGGAIGLGTDYHGKFAGELGAVVSFHKTVKKPFFVVGEVEAGVEQVGSHIKPLAKGTLLAGVGFSDGWGVSFGGSIGVTRDDIAKALAVYLAKGF